MFFQMQNLQVSEIKLALFVLKGTHSALHVNRSSHGIALCCGGKQEFEFDSGIKLIIKKGDIIYLPKKSCYRIKTSLAGDYYAINFELNSDINLLSSSINQNDSEILNLFKQAAKVWSTKFESYNYKVKSILYEILYLIQISAINKTKPNKINSAVNYIKENFCKHKISVNMLANLCNISDTTLRTEFLKQHGMTPVKYINKLKNDKAKELLQSGFYSVQEVCYLCGFSDPVIFSREFKKYLGKPPSKYKANENY